MELNRQWRIAARPYGKPKPTDFQYHEEAIPECGDGEVLLKTLYLGLAPVMRMYMQGESQAGEAPLDIGDVIHGRGVARVIESKHPDYAVGDIVQGQMGWQTYKATKVTRQEKFFKINEHDLSYAYGVSIFSMTGLSAYGGFFDCAKPRAGELVVKAAEPGACWATPPNFRSPSMLPRAAMCRRPCPGSRIRWCCGGMDVGYSSKSLTRISSTLGCDWRRA